MAKLANKNAQVICPFCPGQKSSFSSNKARTVQFKGKPAATVADTKIKAFAGSCIAIPTTPRKCNPQLAKWAMSTSSYKAKGKNVLLQPNLIPCAFGPGVVSMVKPGQKKVSNMAGSSESGTLPCDWKTCENKHGIKIEYPNNGVVEFEPLDDWILPHLVYGPDETYKTDAFPKGQTKVLNSFRKRRHHVIPINVFERLPNISHNLKLLGFDINNEYMNGMCLVFFHEDMVWHDLQAHRGNHPDYDDLVYDKLSRLEGECEDFCKSGDQINLWYKIEKWVNKFREYILNWTWEIHPGTKETDRKRVFKESSDKKSVPALGKRKYFI